MKLARWAVLFLLAAPAYAQTTGPGITASVRVTTTQDPATRLWTYTYEVSSADTSARSIDAFVIETPSRGDVRNVQTPRGWTFGVDGDTSISWSATDPDGIDSAPRPGGGPPVPVSRFRIRPGQSLSGFSFQSLYSPEGHRFSVTSFEPRGPVLAGDQNDDAAAPRDEDIFFVGGTMAPSSPCAAETDPDGDGICGAADNCPNAANADQVDRGGVASSLDPQGQMADRIGDACQCGDTDADGRVTAADATTLRACFEGAAPCNGAIALLPGGLKKCDVGGGDYCERTDVDIIQGAVSGSGVPIQNVCAAFRGSAN